MGALVAGAIALVAGWWMVRRHSRRLLAQARRQAARALEEAERDAEAKLR